MWPPSLTGSRWQTLVPGAIFDSTALVSYLPCGLSNRAVHAAARAEGVPASASIAG